MKDRSKKGNYLYLYSLSVGGQQGDIDGYAPSRGRTGVILPCPTVSAAGKWREKRGLMDQDREGNDKSFDGAENRRDGRKKRPEAGKNEMSDFEKRKAELLKSFRRVFPPDPRRSSEISSDPVEIAKPAAGESLERDAIPEGEREAVGSRSQGVLFLHLLRHTRFGRETVKALVKELELWEERLLFGLVENLYLHCFPEYFRIDASIRAAVTFRWGDEPGPLKLELMNATDITENRELTYLLVGDLLDEGIEYLERTDFFSNGPDDPCFF